MKKVGVFISDAKILYELLEALKADNVPFEMIDPKTHSRDIDFVLTTEADRASVKHAKTVNCTLGTIPLCVKTAKAVLRIKGKIRSLVIGIDPGSSPGVAVLADQSVIDSSLADSPESVAILVRDYTDFYPSDEVLVRIGNGDRTIRNRIFNSIWDLGLPIEIVDERNTTSSNEQRDINSAIEIALTPGYKPVKKQPVDPSEGEIADIQRKSRICSNGELTISRSLAVEVAKGDLSMESAIKLHKDSKKWQLTRQTEP